MKKKTSHLFFFLSNVSLLSMGDVLVSKKTRPVAIWLLVGFFMIIIQVLLGGITRITGSGLSITDWKPIIGIIPPLNHQDWVDVFQRYQQTPQYRLLNADFNLQDFKSIFFWEWFHRLWARLLAIVFLVPFFIFLFQKRFKNGVWKPMVILFILGGLQGLVGWIMVRSGLVGNNTRVNHIKLAIHFVSAMVLLCYTLWFALRLLIPKHQKTLAPKLHTFTVWLIGILTLQLAYGSFMAGLQAARFATTWPDMNGKIIPDGMLLSPTFIQDITSNPITVQFIHRGFAYLILILILIWWAQARKTPQNRLLYKFCWIPPLFVLLQITLGVLTVLGTGRHIPVVLAISHQFVGMLFLASLFLMLYFSTIRIDLSD